MPRYSLAVVLALVVSVAVGLAAQQGAPAAVPQTLAQRIAHTDPARFRASPRVHDGAGQLQYMALFNAPAFDTNMFFLHRGVIDPKSGIGVHYHNNCEEMFVILDGEAQFTIDGRTSQIKGPAGAPTRLGHSHAIYNPTDRPVQWMNINVTALKGIYDAFNLGDTREGAPLDAIPNFMSSRFDRATLGANYPGGVAKGAIRYRRAFPPSVFVTTWTYVDHVLLEPGAATTKAALPDLGETYYVMAGKGTVVAGDESAPIAAGDALPIRLNEARSFENTGTEPLEMLVIGVSRDMNTKTALMATPPTRGGGVPVGRGAAGGRGRGN